MSAVMELPAAEVGVDAPKLYEIVNGNIEEKEMAGARHGRVGARLISRVNLFVEENNLGGVYTESTMFRVGANNRMPDISFVAAARLPPEGDPAGEWDIAPDLAVEIISPNDVYSKVRAKVYEYFAAGVSEVWLVEPEFSTVTVYFSPTQNAILTEDDDLTSQLLPGFRCRVGDIFPPPRLA